MTSCPSLKIPKSFAMAVAVVLWSPVIIIVRTPACLATLMASFASGRAGSIIPTNPIKSISFSISSTVMLVGILSYVFTATAKTLNASLAISSLAVIAWSLSTSRHLFKITSGPPLVIDT